MTSESDWERAVAETLARFGKLDILVNNAAILRSTPIEHTTVEEWDTVMAVNARGGVPGDQTRDTGDARGRRGSIINISSTAGLVGGQGGAYGTSKGGVRLFSKSAAVQLAKDGIRSNSIHPGPIDTEMVAHVTRTPEGRAAFGARVPMDRIGTVDDIAYEAPIPGLGRVLVHDGRGAGYRRRLQRPVVPRRPLLTARVIDPCS